MSAGPASALAEAQGCSPQVASSAVVVGTARLGEGSLEPVVPGRVDPRGLDGRTSSEVVANLVGDAPVVKAAPN